MHTIYWIAILLVCAQYMVFASKLLVVTATSCLRPDTFFAWSNTMYTPINTQRFNSIAVVRHSVGQQYPRRVYYGSVGMPVQARRSLVVREGIWQAILRFFGFGGPDQEKLKEEAKKLVDELIEICEPTDSGVKVTTETKEKISSMVCGRGR